MTASQASAIMLIFVDTLQYTTNTNILAGCSFMQQMSDHFLCFCVDDRYIQVSYKQSHVFRRFWLRQQPQKFKCQSVCLCVTLATTELKLQTLKFLDFWILAFRFRLDKIMVYKIYQFTSRSPRVFETCYYFNQMKRLEDFHENVIQIWFH